MSPMPNPDAVYDVLVREAGALSDRIERECFVIAHEGGEWRTRCEEYRFQGLLGFGGKYRSKTNTVDCYPEDMTPERAEIIARTNAALAALEGGDDADA